MTILKIGTYYVKCDKINYYSHDEDENETNISCDGVWFCVAGDWTKQITNELIKAERARIIELKESSNV